MTDVLKSQAHSTPSTPGNHAVVPEVSASPADRHTTPTTNSGAESIAAATIVSQAKGVASHVGAEASDLVSSQLAQRGEQSANELDDVARALRNAHQQLAGNVAAPYIGKAADQIDRVSRFVRAANPGEIVETVETVARREPLLFLGGAFALGILGARFLKSSARRDIEMKADASGRPAGASTSAAYDANKRTEWP